MSIPLFISCSNQYFLKETSERYVSYKENYQQKGDKERYGLCEVTAGLMKIGIS